MMKGRKLVTLLAVATLLLGAFAATAAASGGIIGQCADCHTMHNSQAGKPVAQQYGKTSPDGTRNPNLLKFDCLSCHAQDASGPKVAEVGNGSKVPQVYHGDASDLAAGNFKHIAEGGNRKGHNVVDVVPADSTFTAPPGFRHTGAEVGAGGFDVTKFTCAGSMGCHGYRGQAIQVAFADPDCDPEFEICGEDEYRFRTGLEALSGYDGSGTISATPENMKRGAHHNSYDGLKNDGLDPNFYDSPLTHSYRFIRALRGYGNEVDRWQNLSSESHNEYVGGYAETALGEALKGTDFGTTGTCTRCHIGGQGATTSRLTVPGQSTTGFCLTCHGSFHSSGVTNGTSGSFLRHPSDYVLPNSGEYANYTIYDVRAPVARPHGTFVEGMTASTEVNPGTDLVMCLSCHVAHASPYDGMLRFDYAAQTSMMRAGSFASVEDAQAEGGCLACHTTKGVLPQGR